MLIDNLHRIDQNITLAINSLSFPGLGEFMQFMSDKKVWIPLYIMIAFLMFKRLGYKKAFMGILAVLLTILACDQFSNLIKDSVARLRPCYSTYMLEGGLRMLEGRWDYYGFFSAHAANTFGLAASASCILWIDKKNKYNLFTTLIMIWATLVSISRIFVGKHYFGDVLVGILVGLSFGFAIAYIIRFIIKRYNII